MTEFNIIATVGTTEVELSPYPGGGSGYVPADKRRKIYSMVLTNTSYDYITLTLRIYKGTTLEASIPLIIPGSTTLSIAGQKHSPILVVPSGRTLKAVASAASVNVTLAAYDE
jgi:hypothetical protein